MDTIITQKRLKEELVYNTTSGLFFFKRNRRGLPKGKISGHLNAKNGYVDIGFDGKVYKGHQLAWLYCFGYIPDVIDHYNHIRHDNRISNLFISSYSENNKNQGMRKDNKSGFTGVNWKKSDNRWIVQIMINKKKKHIGSFKNLDDAIAARKRANIDYGFHKNHGIKIIKD